MADGDFGDEFGGDYFFDDDYLYVEDEYAIADELVENQIPSPGYSGTNAELAAEFQDWDNYEFWSDLAYGSDSYYDARTKTRRKTPKHDEAVTVERGQKRKRASITTTVTRGKRQRVTIKEEVKLLPTAENVVYRGDQSPLWAPPTPESMESFALFPDWKTRFPETTQVAWQAAMPEDMKRAAEASEDKAASPEVGRSPVKSRKRKAVRKDAGVENEQSSMDLDTLKMILREKLGNGIDEEAFMAVIQDMMAGGGSEEAAEQLTKTLLQGGDTSALSWLGQQGVNIDTSDEEGEEPGKRIDSGAGLPIDPTLKAVAASQDSASPEKSAAKRTPTRSSRKKTRP